jgi:hypothetical protein
MYFKIQIIKAQKKIFCPIQTLNKLGLQGGLTVQ